MVLEELKEYRNKLKLLYLKAILERYTDNDTISPIDKGHFTAVVEVYHNAQFVKWVMGLGNKVKILSPDRIIDDVAYYGRAIGRWHKRVEGD